MLMGRRAGPSAELAAAILLIAVPIAFNAARDERVRTVTIDAPEASSSRGGRHLLLIVFTVLFLAVPAFFLALTIGLGARIRSTGGIAAVALAVLFVPQMLGGMVPHMTELSPTSIGQWAQAVVMGEPAPWSIPVVWGISMIAIIVGAKLVFDRQEF